MPSGFNETPLLVDLIADYVQRLLPIGLLSGVEPAFVPVGLLSEIVYQCVGPMFGWSRCAAHGMACVTVP